MVGLVVNLNDVSISDFRCYFNHHLIWSRLVSKVVDRCSVLDRLKVVVLFIDYDDCFMANKKSNLIKEIIVVTPDSFVGKVVGFISRFILEHPISLLFSYLYLIVFVTSNVQEDDIRIKTITKQREDHVVSAVRLCDLRIVHHNYRFYSIYSIYLHSFEVFIYHCISLGERRASPI